MNQSNCGCGCSSSLVFLSSCSGAADVGALADRVTRALAAEGLGKMTCLAGVGAGISGFVESSKAAVNIAIDGCAVGCGRAIYDGLGIPAASIVLTDLGFVKGQTPVTDESVAEAVARIKNALTGGNQSEKSDSGCAGASGCGCCG